MLVRDRQVMLLLMSVMLATGLTFGLIVALTDWLTGMPAIGLAGLLATWLMFGLVLGLGLSLRQTAWPSYTLTRGWLALRHRLPWRLMSFLTDAHRRGVLRQVGAVYEFRHIELQHRLASRDADEQQAAASPATAVASQPDAT